MQFGRGLRSSALFIVSAAVACAEPNAPAHVVEAVYVAESVDGLPLPFELWTTGTSHYFLESLSIAFESGNEAVRTQTIRTVDEINRLPVLSTSITRYDVLISGDTTTLMPRCRGTTAACIAPTVLVRVGNTYHLLISYEPLRTMTLVRM